MSSMAANRRVSSYGHTSPVIAFTDECPLEGFRRLAVQTALPAYPQCILELSEPARISEHSEQLFRDRMSRLLSLRFCAVEMIFHPAPEHGLLVDRQKLLQTFRTSSALLDVVVAEDSVDNRLAPCGHELCIAILLPSLSLLTPSMHKVPQK